MATEVKLDCNEAICPFCEVVIYLWFVRENGKCPACNKPLATLGNKVTKPL